MNFKQLEQPRKLYEQPAETSDMIPLVELEGYMKDKTPGTFKPGKVRYSRIGEMIEVHWQDDPAYAENCGDVVLLRSFATKQVVGVKILHPKGIMGLVEVKE